MSETGIVRRWWREGFGFITRDDGREWYARGPRKLRAGQRVTFRSVDTPRGPRAEDVKRVE
jgi:cold shock CspA family protein